MPIQLKALAVAALVTASLQASGQMEPSACAQELDKKLNEMMSLTAQAGSVTYKKIMERAVNCMQSGRCSKPDSLVNMQEMMVDQQVIDLQRKKVAAMRRFFARASSAHNDACAVTPLFPSLFEEMNSANQQQFARFEELASRYFPETSNAK